MGNYHWCLWSPKKTWSNETNVEVMFTAHDSLQRTSVFEAAEVGELNKNITKNCDWTNCFFDFLANQKHRLNWFKQYILYIYIYTCIQYIYMYTYIYIEAGIYHDLPVQMMVVFCQLPDLANMGPQCQFLRFSHCIVVQVSVASLTRN
jgi:hypothetical protein